ncbi:MAG: enoyl-CoA hydratase/isomerase family protein [Candidatus Hodarchaeota archaeon]
METIIYEKTGSFLSMEENIGVIKINRPDALNAFNDKLVEELNAILDEIEKDDEIKVVVITADGEKVFSVGADLKFAQGLTEKDKEESRPLIQGGQELFRKLENLSKPTIAAINGLALGGGTEITLACDIRIANESAKIGTPEVGVGLLPAWGGTTRLPKIIGMGRAKEMILTGGQVSGTEAERIGLVNKAVPYDELESTWTFMAAKIAGNAPVAVKLAKQVANKAFDNTIEDGNRMELNACVECFGTEDLKEGIKAVFEKRKANFQGK